MRYSQIDSHVRVPSLSRFPCFRTGTWPLNRSPSASEGGRGNESTDFTDFKLSRTRHVDHI